MYDGVGHSCRFLDNEFADDPLTPSQVTLKTYTGEVLNVSGEMHCDIVYKGKQYSLPILVANYDANLHYLVKTGCGTLR